MHSQFSHSALRETDVVHTSAIVDRSPFAPFPPYSGGIVPEVEMPNEQQSFKNAVCTVPKYFNILLETQNARKV